MTEPTHFKVKNWEQFQHYKDRNPPWIKLHFALLASEDWVTLDDTSRVLMLACMLVASRNDGMVPNRPAYIKRVAYLKRLPNFKPLISCGFLEIPQATASALLANASTLQADASVLQANARPETEHIDNTDKKESSSSRGKRVTEIDEIEVEFEKTFWPAYPRKVDKKDALKAFRAARKTVALDVIMVALAAYCREVKGKDKQYIRHAARWLHAENWTPENDAVAPVALGDDGKWPRRLLLARQRQAWSTGEWGPAPGLPGCRVPAGLISDGDGIGWTEWEIAA